MAVTRLVGECGGLTPGVSTSLPAGVCSVTSSGFEALVRNTLLVALFPQRVYPCGGGPD